MFRKILHRTLDSKKISYHFSNYEIISQFIVQKKYFSELQKDEHNLKKEMCVDNVDESKDIQPNAPTDKSEQLTDLLENSASFNDATNREWLTPPYPEDAMNTLNEKQKVRKISPEDTSIFLFPGQGTLKVGTVKKYVEYPRVKELFEIGRSILGYNILDLCLNGPQEKLNSTQFNQVATVMTSLAALEKLWADSPDIVTSCKCVAGYSVGELAALAYAGSLSIEDTIRLASVRGIAMQKASELEPQGMITVIHTQQTESMGKICQEARNWAANLGVSEPVCNVSSFLYANAKVISGHLQAIEFIQKNYQRFHIKRVMKLPVSGAFHSPLMSSAMNPFRKALMNIEIEEPRIVVYSNIKAKPYSSAIEVRTSLTKQIIKQSKWEQILHAIYTRPQDHIFPNSYDLGSNGTMKTILSKLNLAASEHCTVV